MRPQPPVPWTNPDLLLFHGTTETQAHRIVEEGIRLSMCKLRRDFGPGFYATTSDRQAKSWATLRVSRNAPSERPAVLVFRLNRDELASLDALTFIRASTEAEDFWNFVGACRTGQLGHGRAERAVFYDVVFGPVMAGTFDERRVHPDFDQVSFHTDRAIQILTRKQFHIL